MKISRLLLSILLLCNGTRVFSQQPGHFMAANEPVTETAGQRRLNTYSLRNTGVSADSFSFRPSIRSFSGPYALNNYVAGSTDLNTYQEPGLYEFETAGGALTNTPHGTVGSSNYKVINLGGTSRSAQLLFETANNAVWVRNNWDWGAGIQHTPWDRLALISELGNSAFVGYAYGADAYTMVRRDEAGHVKANYYHTLAGLEVGSTALTGVFAASGDGFIRKFDVSSVRYFLGIPAQGETLISVTARNNRSLSNLALSKANTPNPNTTGIDQDYEPGLLQFRFRNRKCKGRGLLWKWPAC